MNTATLQENAKHMIDDLFNNVDELKIKAEQISHNMREEWNSEISKLETSKKELNNIYAKISNANDASIQELSKALDEQKASVQKRIEHMREIYSKMLN